MMQRPTHRLQTQQAYQMAVQGSVKLHKWAQPLLETSDIDLIQQCLATSRAIHSYITAAWSYKHNQESFIGNLSAAQLEASEMQIWIEAAIAAGYLDSHSGQDLYDHYRNLYKTLDQLMEDALRAPKPIKKTSLPPSQLPLSSISLCSLYHLFPREPTSLRTE
jgi:four helix bundle protein